MKTILRTLLIASFVAPLAVATTSVSAKNIPYAKEIKKCKSMGGVPVVPKNGGLFRCNLKAKPINMKNMPLGGSKPVGGAGSVNVQSTKVK